MRSLEEMTEKEQLAYIGEQLQKIRLKEDITQSQLAEKTGMNRSNISTIETGGNPTLSSFLRILKVYGRLDDLQEVLHTPEISPMEMLKLRAKEKKYASRSKSL